MSSTINCDVFTYTKLEMEITIMIYFKPSIIPVLKKIIDDDYDGYSQKIRKNIWKRILQYINGFDWWECDNNQNLATELVLIWKLAISLMKGFFENGEGLVETFQRELAFWDLELEQEKINEQRYIEISNSIRDRKDETEELMNVCVCSLIGKMNQATITINGESRPNQLVFRVMSLPCGWSASSPV